MKSVQKLLHSIFSNIYCHFMNLKLNRKLLIGYLILVVIPVAAIFGIVSYTTYQNARKTYINSQIQEMNVFNNQFTADLNQIANYSYFFQNNTDILSYLNGDYTTVSTVLYHYYESMLDTFHCASHDDRVKNLKIYGMKEYALVVPNRLEEISSFDIGNDFIQEIKSHMDGMWTWEKDGALTYHRVLYDKDYRFALGLLEISVDTDQLLENLLKNYQKNYFYIESEEPAFFIFENNHFDTCDNHQAETVLLSSETITQPLDTVEVTVYHPLEALPDAQIYWTPVFISVIMLILFSILYYVIGRSLTKRLVDFTQYISTQEARTLVCYEKPIYQDEIGSTIFSYNQLILRVNELIHNNYEVSLKMKEARYYALQAQIKPHFLYNILENIHMSSLAHNDLETAGMTATFGNYLRYAINDSTLPEPLSTEIKAAKDYLDVYKIRLGTMLTYHISINVELDDVFCPRFIIQPLLENAIKHGAIPDIPLHVSIDVYGEDEDEMSPVIYVRIIDNGAGIEPEHLTLIREVLNTEVSLPPSRHVGLRNVNDRLKAFVNIKCPLSIDCTSEGTIISFALKRGKITESMEETNHENTDC